MWIISTFNSVDSIAVGVHSLRALAALALVESFGTVVELLVVDHDEIVDVVAVVDRAMVSSMAASVLNIVSVAVDADLVVDTFAPVCIKFVSELVWEKMIIENLC